MPEPEVLESKKEREMGRVGGVSFDLPIEDKDLADIIDNRVEETEKYYKTQLHLEERRKINEEFWLGKQYDESQMYNWQIPAKDNLIWQDLETRISIAASRMPDIIVTPASQMPEKIEAAKSIERGLNISLGSDIQRRVIKDGLRFHHLYFTAAIKCYWDRNRNGFTADNMEFIVEWVEAPVAQVISDFPDKKDEIFKEMRIIKGTAKQLNSKMRYQECWFSFFGDNGKLYEGVCWKYKKMILGKQRNPYYDWEGYEKIKNGNGETENVYRNHFEKPRKPYIFFTYQNLGKSPIDETTPVEQAIPLQKLVNKRSRQITEIADRNIPRMIFTSDAVTKEEARKITNDPDEHIVLGSNVQDVRAAAMVVVSPPPSPTLFQDLLVNRTQIDAKFATHATTRGERVAQESGIARQIVREGDLAAHDDMSRVIIERVIFEMANWAVQMMKLFYDKEHFVKDVGKDGELSYIELKRDLIEDGIAVNVRSSSVDKAQRRFDAQTAAARRQIDPLSYWEDLDAPNPKERTKRLIAFLSGQFNVYSQLAGLTPQSEEDRGIKEAEMDIERIKRGEDFEPPKPTPGYLTTMIRFVNSQDFRDLPKKVQNRFRDFSEKLRAKFEKDYLPPETSPTEQSPEPLPQIGEAPADTPGESLV